MNEDKKPPVINNTQWVLQVAAMLGLSTHKLRRLVIDSGYPNEVIRVTAEYWGNKALMDMPSFDDLRIEIVEKRPE